MLADDLALLNGKFNYELFTISSTVLEGIYCLGDFLRLRLLAPLEVYAGYTFSLTYSKLLFISLSLLSRAVFDY